MATRLRAESEWITAKNHHEPYITHSEWQRIQDALKAGQPTARPPAGKGGGLLQGLVWCGRCARWMHTVYWRRATGSRRASYACRKVTETCETLHEIHCLARLLDDAVSDAVLAALSPTTIQSALEVIERQRADQAGLERTHARQLRHAEDEVEAARRRHKDADSKHKAVRAELEAEWERAIQRRDELKRHLAGQSPEAAATVDPGMASRLVELTRNIRELWEAATTTNEDRKRLLRTVLTKVVVKESNREAVVLELIWVGGLHQTVEALRSKGVDRFVVEKHRQGKVPHVIANELNTARLRDAYGRLFSAQSVRQRLHTLGINLKAERHNMLLTLRQMLIRTTPESEILTSLAQDFPRSAPRTIHKLRVEICALCRGERKVPRPPIEIVAYYVRRRRSASEQRTGRSPEPEA
jgi:hypothetical protein